MARQGQRRSREKESIQRASDHRHPEGVGGRGGDRRAVPPARDRAGVFLPWKSKFGGLELNEARRLRQLEEENRQLKREGWQVNHKRVYRLYVEEKLLLRRKRGRKRSTVRQPLPAAMAVNRVWSVDFMSDALSSGRRFRTLNIVDDYTRERLAI